MDTHLTRLWMRAVATAMDLHKDRLTQLDSAIGDADHGVNMQRGFTAVVAALDDYEAENVGDVLVKTGTTLISSVGGAAGPLYGTFFRTAGKQLTAPTADGGELASALGAGLRGLQKLGAAVPGDKTMVDALMPALAAFDSEAPAAAAAKAADAAEAGMRGTIPMQARKGRASYLGARSVGHQDPGATSAALIFRALVEVLQP
ncbi:dihydroxyacetone kinase-like protein [Catenulispora sp. MAP12-49]|uniref:dihydroxyacetone kinase subunit DhaL n=1 Tax=Catenulispora sp. MAP12-49 TaxID=3156302 RepID=UPI00351667C7